jgi:hypothetical protein
MERAITATFYTRSSARLHRYFLTVSRNGVINAMYFLTVRRELGIELLFDED